LHLLKTPVDQYAVYVPLLRNDLAFGDECGYLLGLSCVEKQGFIVDSLHDRNIRKTKIAGY
jgi:hypothetical protein